MSPADRIPVWLRILLPCLLIALLGLQPASQPLRRAFEQARVAEARKDPGAAAARYRDAVSIEPWRVDLWEVIGQNELAAGEYAKAADALRTADRSRALSPDGRLALGSALQLRGDEQGALEVWRQVGSPGAYENIYRLVKLKDDPAAELAVLKAWGARYPLDVSNLYRQGLLMAVLEPENSLTVLEAAAKKDHDLSGKVDILRKALSLAFSNPVEAYQRVVIGRALGSLNEWALAKIDFEKATKLAPDYAEGWAFLGEARQHIGQDGYADLQKASQISPKSMIVQALFSIYYRREGNPKKALEILDTMIAQEPDQTVWLLEAGDTQASAGNLIAALPYFQKAVQLEPENTANWLAMAHFSLDYMSDVDTVGLEAARKAVDLSPDDPGALDCLGEALFKLNDLPSAERFLQRALEIDRSFAATNLHLGQVYLQENKNADAFPRLQTASQNDPDGEIGDLARRLIDQYFPNGQEP